MGIPEINARRKQVGKEIKRFFARLSAPEVSADNCIVGRIRRDVISYILVQTTSIKGTHFADI